MAMHRLSRTRTPRPRCSGFGADARSRMCASHCRAAFEGTGDRLRHFIVSRLPPFHAAGLRAVDRRRGPRRGALLSRTIAVLHAARRDEVSIHRPEGRTRAISGGKSGLFARGFRDIMTVSLSCSGHPAGRRRTAGRSGRRGAGPLISAVARGDSGTMMVSCRRPSGFRRPCGEFPKRGQSRPPEGSRRAVVRFR